MERFSHWETGLGKYTVSWGAYVVNYNALGTATFIVAYVGVADFQSFWNGVYTYLKAFSYPLEVKRSVEEMAHTSAAVRCANTILSRGGYDFPVYFIAVNIGRG